MRITSKTRVAPLAKLFPYESEDSQKNLMHAQIARLCVLHEDLRLEVAAAYDDSFLLHNGKSSVTKNARQGYFWRRSVNTLQEFSQAIVLLDEHDGFALARSRWRERLSADWGESVKHFKKVKHTLSKIRNDIGGHFTVEAAFFALEQLKKAELGEVEGIGPSIGAAEYCPHSMRRGQESEFPLRLHFACHISTVAILKRRQGEENPWLTASKIITDLWKESLKHSYRAMSAIFWGHLWPQFGR